MKETPNSQNQISQILTSILKYFLHSKVRDLLDFGAEFADHEATISTNITNHHIGEDVMEKFDKFVLSLQILRGLASPLRVAV